MSAQKRKEMASHSLLMQITFALVLSCLFYIFSNNIISNNIYSESPKNLLLIVSLQIPFLLIIEYCLDLFRWVANLKYYSILSISSSLATAFMVMAIFFDRSNDIHTVFLIYLFSRVLFAIIGLFLCFKKVNNITIV